MRGGGEVEVLSLESVDSTETCEDGSTVLNVRVAGSTRGEKGLTEEHRGELERIIRN